MASNPQITREEWDSNRRRQREEMAKLMASNPRLEEMVKMGERERMLEIAELMASNPRLEAMKKIMNIQSMEVNAVILAQKASKYLEDEKVEHIYNSGKFCLTLENKKGENLSISYIEYSKCEHFNCRIMCGKIEVRDGIRGTTHVDLIRIIREFRESD
jgi:hypothetical protein